MFKNRCCERPMQYNEESFKFSSVEAKDSAYPMATEPAMMMGSCMNPGCPLPPVYECPQERVCHREFTHEVPHIVPINTRVINHHIYRHSYTPCYTCCEEDVVCNVYDGCPNRF